MQMQIVIQFHRTVPEHLSYASRSAWICMAVSKIG